MIKVQFIHSKTVPNLNDLYQLTVKDSKLRTNQEINSKTQEKIRGEALVQYSLSPHSFELVITQPSEQAQLDKIANKIQEV